MIRFISLLVAFSLLAIPLDRSAQAGMFSSWVHVFNAASVFDATCFGDCEVSDVDQDRVWSFENAGSFNFEVNSNPAEVQCRIELIGGGAGGGNDVGGGGGAGEYENQTGVNMPVDTYPVVVGDGGAGGAAGATGPADNGAKNGGNTTWDGGTYTALGGGYGSWLNNAGFAWAAAVTGGSGGGGSATAAGASGTAAGGGVAFAGGNGTGDIGANTAGGGGGGAGGAGSAASSGTPGNGGAGINTTILGSSDCVAGGGGGGMHSGTTNVSSATCGGGAGGNTQLGTGGSNATKAGAGGGGGGGTGPNYPGGNGYKGRLVVRCPYQKFSSYAALLLHFDGANGGTTFLDSGSDNRTMSTNGAPVISTTSQKFDQNGNFASSNSHLTTPVDADLSFGTGDFTIQMWAYYGTWGDGSRGLLTLGDDSGDEDWSFEFSNANGMRFTSSKHGFTNGTSVQPTNNTWHHFEISRASGTLKIFINGVQQFSGTNTTNFAVTGGTNLYVARRPANANYFEGRLDEVLIIKGKALHTANFTPPSVPYE